MYMESSGNPENGSQTDCRFADPRQGVDLNQRPLGYELLGVGEVIENRKQGTMSRPTEIMLVAMTTSTEFWSVNGNARRRFVIGHARGIHAAG